MKVLFAAALALCFVLPAAAQPAGPLKMDERAIAPPHKSLSVKLDGRIKTPATFSLADLKAMPAVTVDVDYAEQGKSSWKGALLMPIIDKAATVQPEGHGAYLQHLIVALGTDGYGVGLAIGEIEPKFEGKQVIIAYEKDGKPLDSLRLVIPGDAHAGRGVRDLSEITVY